MSYGQSHRFSDLGVLFSQQELSGTARYKGLSGAMGALGGDISAINYNPAGLGIFNHNNFTISLGTENKKTTAKYYNNSIENNVYSFNLNQLGLAFVLEQNYSDWNKVVLAANYQKTNNYNNLFNAVGNSGFASFNKHPNVGLNESFDNGIRQDLENDTSGNSTVFNLGLGAQYKQNLYLGVSLNIHNINHTQKTTINEINANGANERIDALFDQFDSNSADGISLNVGTIYKLSPFIRIGLAYQSPTWYYNITNESNIYDGRQNTSFGRATGNTKSANITGVPNTQGEILINGNLDLAPFNENINGYKVTNNQLDVFEYNLKTANKFNISSAFIIKKMGFISLDYSYHNYNALNLSGDGGFTSENTYFSDVLKNSHNVRAGGELRLNNLSLRGGVRFEQSPFDESKTADIDVLRFGDKYGASLGAGLRLENHKFDLSYNYTEQNNSYDFYDQYDNVNPVALNLKQSKVEVTYTYIF